MQLLWPSRAVSCWSRSSCRGTRYFLIKAQSKLGPHPVPLQTAANEPHTAREVSAQGKEQFAAFKPRLPLASRSCWIHTPWDRDKPQPGTEEHLGGSRASWLFSCPCLPATWEERGRNNLSSTRSFLPSAGAWDICRLEPWQAGKAQLPPVAASAGTIDRLATITLPRRLNPVASCAPGERGTGWSPACRQVCRDCAGRRACWAQELRLDREESSGKQLPVGGQ